MLTKIKLKNVYSIKDCEIDFTRGKFGYKKENIFNERLVNPLALYGYNGSGKSNVLKGIAYVISIMNRGENQPIYPNIFSGADKSIAYLVSTIQLEFSCHNSNYTYMVSILNNSIMREELFLGDLRLVERMEDKYFLYNKEMVVKQVKNKDKSILLECQQEFYEAYDYLANMVYIADHRTNSIARVLFTSDIYHMFTKYSSSVKEILDSTVGSISYEVIEKQGDYYLQFSDNNLIPISAMSTGMFNESLLLSLIMALPENEVIFVDELERSLHPYVLRQILRLINEKHIQLVFTSQNTHLMQYLRPDQIYFASYLNYETKLIRLSQLDNSIREVNNIEKMYLEEAFSQ